MLRWREPGRVSADLIPFYHEGKYHLFFLNGYDEGTGWSRSQTPWGHLTTTDLVQYERLPDAIEPGPQGSGDGLACYTGSVVVHQGLWHLYYTGFSPLNPEGRERILHATSTDGVTFTKDASWKPMYPDTRFYGCDGDFRDPFVFWNEEEQLFCMTITAGAAAPTSASQRGVVGLAKSADLSNWEVFPPIYNPESYMPMECTDLFRENGRWYMLFSQYGVTEYRYADSIYGPWQMPADPVLDGGSSAFYAAKTLYDGKRRLLWGWCGTSPDGKDSVHHMWGGDIVSPRELYVCPNGELGVRLPQEVEASCTPVPVAPIEKLGRWTEKDGAYQNESKPGLSLLALRDSSDAMRLRCDVQCHGAAGTAGILLCCPDDLYQYYWVRVDIGRHELEILRAGAVPTIYGSICDGPRRLASQPLPGLKEQFTMDLVYRNGVLEVFFDECKSITARLTDFRDGKVMLAAEHVQATFCVKCSEIQ